MKKVIFHSDQHLSLEELIEYSQGNLSNSEMHRLEVHLITCEICNEAVEGVSSIRRQEDVLPSINRIQTETGTKVNYQLSLQHYLGIAASILIIAVLGFIFLGDSATEENLAVQSEQLKEDNNALKNNDTGSEQLRPLDNTNTIDTTLLALNNETPDEVSSKGSAAEQSPSAATTPAQPLELKPKPIAFSDSNPIEVASRSEEDILPDSSFIAETVVADQVGNDLAAKKSAQPSNANENAAPAAVREETIKEVETLDAGIFVPAEPIRGMKAYDRYIKRNTNLPEAAKTNNISGDVELLVEINPDGSIATIEITKALGYGCDEEAMRVVRDGNAWQSATMNGTAVSDKVRVIVSFMP